MSETRMPDAVLPLHPSGVPDSKGNTPEDNPWLELFRAPNSTGGCVLVFPGGGYCGRAEHEAAPIALWLNTLGITAAVVHYRVRPYQHPQPLNDVSAAMRIARDNAAAWGINAARIGILGFSAGGHLASTLSVHYDRDTRPALAILLYPLITMIGRPAHQGSRMALLPDPSDEAMVRHLSTDLHVTAQTPPTFIFHTADDPVVPVENPLLYAAALRKNGVPFELHIYETGSHGVGLAANNAALATWPTLCANWLRTRGFAR